MCCAFTPETSVLLMPLCQTRDPTLMGFFKYLTLADLPSVKSLTSLRPELIHTERTFICTLHDPTIKCKKALTWTNEGVLAQV